MSYSYYFNNMAEEDNNFSGLMDVIIYLTDLMTFSFTDSIDSVDPVAPLVVEEFNVVGEVSAAA